MPFSFNHCSGQKHFSGLLCLCFSSPKQFSLPSVLLATPLHLSSWLLQVTWNRKLCLAIKLKAWITGIESDQKFILATVFSIKPSNLHLYICILLFPSHLRQCHNIFMIVLSVIFHYMLQRDTYILYEYLANSFVKYIHHIPPLY